VKREATLQEVIEAIQLMFEVLVPYPCGHAIACLRRWDKILVSTYPTSSNTTPILIAIIEDARRIALLYLPVFRRTAIFIILLYYITSYLGLV